MKTNSSMWVKALLLGTISLASAIEAPDSTSMLAQVGQMDADKLNQVANDVDSEGDDDSDSADTSAEEAGAEDASGLEDLDIGQSASEAFRNIPEPEDIVNQIAMNGILHGLNGEVDDVEAEAVDGSTCCGNCGSCGGYGKCKCGGYGKRDYGYGRGGYDSYGGDSYGGYGG